MAKFRDSLWDTIMQDLSNNPGVGIKQEDLLSHLRKNTTICAEAVKDITNTVFSFKQFELPGLQEATAQCFLIPLCSKFYIGNTDYKEWEQDIKIPVRSLNCKHADVFDYGMYMSSLALGKQECPVCHEKIDPLSLYIDTRILSVCASSDPLNSPIAVAIPMPDAPGFDQQKVRSYTVADIEQIVLEGGISTGIYAQARRPEAGDAGKFHADIIYA